MKTHPYRFRLLLWAALALAPLLAARAEDSVNTIAFSDPSKPGTLKIRVWRGDVAIHGADVKEIAVKADAEDAIPTPRKDGMRVLSASSNYTVAEKGNVVTLEYGSDGWSGNSADFDITVPRSTSIIVANSVHGDVACSGVSGDIDVRTVHGDVQLKDVTGGALVETVKGEINVTVKSLAESRPLSFTSMGGEVVIRVPSDLKAAVRFRTHRGQILTNFDDKSLVTKTEVTVRKRKVPATPPSPDTPQAAAGRADAAQAAPKVESDDDWRDDVRTSIREAVTDAALAAKDAAEAAKEGMAEAKIEISGSFDGIPPLPLLPPMTGGKTVSGTLNGGGVEIQAMTLNGDITLKKIE